MDISPPSIPADFWPGVPAIEHRRWPFGNLRLDIPAKMVPEVWVHIKKVPTVRPHPLPSGTLRIEIPVASESEVLKCLSKEVHSLMEGAGVLLAEDGWHRASWQDKPHPEVSRSCVKRAAHLLSVYEAVYRGKRRDGGEPSPDHLRDSAVQTYRREFVNQREYQEIEDYYDSREPDYNQDLYGSVQEKGQAKGLKFHR